MTNTTKTLVWVDGKPCQSLNPADRGLAYGDGLFETMRYESGAIALLELHLQRLNAGCKALSLPSLDEWLPAVLEQLDTEMQSLLGDRQKTPYLVKLLVTRGLGGQGYVPSSSPSSPTIVLRIMPLEVSESNAREGVVLNLCRWRLALTPLLAGIKHLNRLEYVLAAQELVEQQSTAQGLLMNANGRVIESLHHNIFIVKRGELITPKIDMCGVKGVMRTLIIDRLAREIGVEVREQELSIDDVMGAAEVFLCNSVQGIWPVREFRGSQWEPGPITKQLQALTAQIWQGNDAG